jgi:hypothetical protein
MEWPGARKTRGERRWGTGNGGRRTCVLAVGVGAGLGYDLQVYEAEG